jgi:hypothetical protein
MLSARPLRLFTDSLRAIFFMVLVTDDNTDIFVCSLSIPHFTVRGMRFAYELERLQHFGTAFCNYIKEKSETTVTKKTTKQNNAQIYQISAIAETLQGRCETRFRLEK